MRFEMTAVGIVHNDRPDPALTDHWGAVTSTIVVDPRFGDDCMLGLAEFSHVDVFFVFDRATERPDHRPRCPRGRADLPEVGMFADRGPNRPNRLGMTTCRIVAVRGRELTVRGLDAAAGTPVVDLKPAMAEFRPAEISQPEWVGRLMADYFLP
ncbi:tRNA (N6-threonylcarbamoyladenosine(37)-N6)-methyltransferase TrmO [Catellatospora sp. IY07-71]|uniref:SAM-dependent methyltransferase n=1 Tax=Catellatospora sp. IY07-71 TaxID=2728827 RepID=UPI001BB75EFB|nr:SAM-dependent methyltransferase [Catellatospora sp. IY07-71]BCJ75359.1 tRNA (N6-threonylcarbamoyladenosine(37)-N6)-methyltransferase TrmO [Catellatospora sp. IY07-71]